MLNWIASMPNLSAYGTPTYFLYLLLAILPLGIGLYYGKRFSWYEALISFIFLFLMFDGSSAKQMVSLVIYVVYQTILVMGYYHYRQKNNAGGVFYITIFLSLLPIVIVKVTPAMVGHNSLLGFLGISYLTFRAAGTIIETRDGAVKEINWWKFVRFMLFMPTITSGPIDRYRRFSKDYRKVPSREKYLGMVEKGIMYLFIGFLYKFVIDYFFAQQWLPAAENMAMAHGHHLSWWVVAVAYLYSGDLYFDFAGYSLFAVAISYFMGVETPMNFNKPFVSKNIKEFWNRWHMSLSFWFRDYIFMRFVFLATKKHWFKNRNVLSSLAYMINMVTMGFWHGVTWYYILYGFLHGFALVTNDAWLRYKRKHFKGLESTALTQNVARFITFNFVVFSFLIFSGFLNTLFFGH
ncbi:MAG: D-alanyl-lipoteichoic acid biosynthesis protein DltB [[Lactobacillus] timonensis]|jgi:membrane protein involved in D-alanine export|uniref:D-alanyl-lipoteichoic acid biosynthesis protein DltB n=1 Tax=[Lactobacillus] timonensis TaxID=1970790 RepID=UPI000C85067C|nr:D-alanyl-lipoteichoic acid biosynthesis protein DltB [[Lactobacillus] timonensis]MCI1287754.1 D-alanyl-lipoteichoic acid biosynthesis protein DltB [[Lactobacillus] timonensis]MCI1925892.1 D-alanyl-lipoteichoic acid biosynthesis protein DltB [[Lactobacillus] timonensis]MCI1957277.1 D-alanyl-lipoteichoic acid biosynthesis protein DltB [[Lactobacillus] timonensis]MCI1970271.1 D-alanyl-lipoteichoic acid biosynthesis protein DltB [[Lactobacillus] timonensis]MCI2006471.1 D-alanyl-lipoteichoic aci